MTEIEQLEIGEARWRFYSAINAIEDIFLWLKRVPFRYRQWKLRKWRRFAPIYHALHEWG